jgi:hypothetical protein
VRPADDPFARLRRHRYGGVVEELMEEPSLLVATMFGFVTCYVHGRCMLALADKRPPWRGLLIPTAREHHAALRALLPALAGHPVLGKWLYLRDSAPTFEEDARRLVALARADDPRIGVESAKFGRATAQRGRNAERGASTKKRRR